MAQILKWPKLEMTGSQKWTKLKSNLNSKIIQVQKWVEFKNDWNSKMTKIKKLPKF